MHYLRPVPAIDKIAAKSKHSEWLKPPHRSYRGSRFHRRSCYLKHPLAFPALGSNPDMTECAKDWKDWTLSEGEQDGSWYRLEACVLVWSTSKLAWTFSADLHVASLSALRNLLSWAKLHDASGLNSCHFSTRRQKDSAARLRKCQLSTVLASCHDLGFSCLTWLAVADQALLEGRYHNRGHPTRPTDGKAHRGKACRILSFFRSFT